MESNGVSALAAKCRKQLVPSISIFVPSMREGGAEKVMARLANEFVKAGHAVDLVLAQKVGPNLRLVDKRVNIVDLRSRRVVSALIPLALYLNKAKPRAILSTMTHANVVAAMAFRLSFCRGSLVLREAALPNSNLDATRRGAVSWVYFLARYAYRWSSSVICVSGGVRNSLLEIFSMDDDWKYRVVYNPTIDDELYRLARANMTPDHNQCFDKPVVLAIGRLEEVKRFDTLIKSFAIVRRSIDCNLFLLGTGSLEPELRRLADSCDISDSVIFAGYQNNPYPYISRANVLVSSSRSEGMPNALIEALALGTSVVSTDIANGPREILEDGRWGQLVSVGDHKNMAKAIVESIHNPMYVPMCAAWWSRFDSKSIVSAYLGYLLAGDHRRIRGQIGRSQ